MCVCVCTSVCSFFLWARKWENDVALSSTSAGHQHHPLSFMLAAPRPLTRETPKIRRKPKTRVDATRDPVTGRVLGYYHGVAPTSTATKEGVDGRTCGPPIAYPGEAPEATIRRLQTVLRICVADLHERLAATPLRFGSDDVHQRNGLAINARYARRLYSRLLQLLGTLKTSPSPEDARRFVRTFDAVERKWAELPTEVKEEVGFAVWAPPPAVPSTPRPAHIARLLANLRHAANSSPTTLMSPAATATGYASASASASPSPLSLPTTMSPVTPATPLKTTPGSATETSLPPTARPGSSRSHGRRRREQRRFVFDDVVIGGAGRSAAE